MQSIEQRIAIGERNRFHKEQQPLLSTETKLTR